MTSQKDETAAEALSDLLDKEREALVTGDLEWLQKMLTPKEDLLERLKTAGGADRGMMAGLDQKLKRNQLLLDGALEGIRAVSSRLAQFRDVSVGLDTYDATGRRREVRTEPGSSVERRA